jgi:hypothetical protein
MQQYTSVFLYVTELKVSCDYGHIRRYVILGSYLFRPKDHLQAFCKFVINFLLNPLIQCSHIRFLCASVGLSV